MNIKVSIYEDNDVLRETLSYLVLGTSTLELMGAYPDCAKVMENCIVARPDVILMDIDMPGISGIEATAMVKATFPEINIMILTIFEDKNKVFEALCSGATGYMLKKSSSVEIIEAIAELHNGGSPMTGEIARKVFEFFVNPVLSKSNDYALSAREFDILKCLVEGDSYKMIADACCISMGTVRFHINNIYRKLHVNSKSEAVIKTLKERLVR